MTQEQVSALLGRPLTTLEETNFDLYLEIAQENLEELLCITFGEDTSGDEDTFAQTFDIREGYRTIFTDIFTDPTEVKIDDTVTTDYTPQFWDKKNGSYFNSIVLDDLSYGTEVEITATWGFAEIPSDLQLLWAQMFANVSKKYVPGSSQVRSKQVEDFRITYGDVNDDEAFISANDRTIKKYSLCNVGYFISGDVCKLHRLRRCGNCF